MASEVQNLLFDIRQAYKAYRTETDTCTSNTRTAFIQERIACVTHAANQLVALVGAERAETLSKLTLDVVDLELKLETVRHEGRMESGSLVHDQVTH